MSKIFTFLTFLIATALSDTYKYRHICTGPGEFPDPFDCSQTIICPGYFAEPVEKCACPSGSTVYPTEGLRCVSGACPRKPISCSPGKTGYFEMLNGTKTNYHYYCKSENEVEVSQDEIWGSWAQLNVPGKNCVNYNDELTTLPPDQPTAAPTSTSHPFPTSSPPPTLPPHYPPACRLRGQRFPAECDCDYYICDRYLIPRRQYCPPRMFYAPRLKVCVRGYCDESLCIGRPGSNSD